MWCFREFCSLSSKARQSCDGRGDSGLDQRDAILPPKSGGLGTSWQCEIQGGSWNNDCSITLARVFFVIWWWVVVVVVEYGCWKHHVVIKWWCWNTCCCCCCCCCCSGGNDGGGGVPPDFLWKSLAQAAGRCVPGPLPWRVGSLTRRQVFTNCTPFIISTFSLIDILYFKSNPSFFHLVVYGIRCSNIFQAVCKNLVHTKQAERAYACLTITSFNAEKTSIITLFHHLCKRIYQNEVACGGQTSCNRTSLGTGGISYATIRMGWSILALLVATLIATAISWHLCLGVFFQRFSLWWIQ